MFGTLQAFISHVVCEKALNPRKYSVPKTQSLVIFKLCYLTIQREVELFSLLPAPEMK